MAKKKNTGRPSLPDGEARTNVISVRLSDRELSLIERTVPTNISTWAREVLLSKAANMPPAKKQR